LGGGHGGLPQEQGEEPPDRRESNQYQSCANRRRKRSHPKGENRGIEDSIGNGEEDDFFGVCGHREAFLIFRPKFGENTPECHAVKGNTGGLSSFHCFVSSFLRLAVPLILIHHHSGESITFQRERTGRENRATVRRRGTARAGCRPITPQPLLPQGQRHWQQWAWTSPGRQPKSSRTHHQCAHA
jgi:hypothetical protein